MNDIPEPPNLGEFFNERLWLMQAVAVAKQAEQAAPLHLKHQHTWAVAEALGRFQTHQESNTLELRTMLSDAEATGGAVLDWLAVLLAPRLGLRFMADAIPELQAGRAAR